MAKAATAPIAPTPAGHYAALEVSHRASAEVIKAAYHALAKANHPDLHPGNKKAADIFREANEAFSVLSDPAKRKEYDTSLKTPATDTILGNYKVLEPIAEGGFGMTYKGEQVINKQLVCIKHCSEVSAAHDAVLIAEANAIWDLRHYALPAMRDMHRLDDGSLALIMSYIPGPTLEQIVEKAGKLDAETCSWIVERILNALLYLHHHGVVHGDLKPQNVVVQQETHSVVLLDFGLSVVKPTSSTKAKGYTPIFAPPEQIAMKPLLPQSDFYSLGMLMLYLLSGGDMKVVERLEVPQQTPVVIQQFIKSLVARDILARPDGDLFEKFRAIRLEAFGRARSGMKAITGL
jgi:serine/threonine protein kinase